MAQDALYAAHADAVPLSQFSLWCTGTAVCQQLADDLLAQSVDEPPASAGRKRGSGAVVVELDMGDRLGSMRHYVPNIRVRVEAHMLHYPNMVVTRSFVLLADKQDYSRISRVCPECCRR